MFKHASIRKYSAPIAGIIVALSLLAIGLRCSAASPNRPPAGKSGSGIVWQAGKQGLHAWENARDGQCGSPVEDGTKFIFTLTMNGKSCYRNQVQPLDTSGNLSRLSDGQQYTWTFRYIDGTPKGDQGMGYDSDARSLIFQIHPYAGGDPCAVLAFNNSDSDGRQQWILRNCDGIVWSGSYKPGERDDWKIVILVSQTDSGYISLYRNGSLVAKAPGATYTNAHGGTGDPWWNFGPYKWRWELPNAGGSGMTRVNATIDDMTMTSP
jgi:hypothetical protein